VKPEGAAFDDIGRGEMEGVSNVQAPSEVAASKSLEVLKQISSTGYLRKRMPQELIVLNGGGGETALATGTDTAVVADAGLRGRSLRRMRQLHAGAQRDLHEVQYLRRYVGVQLRN